MVLSEILSRESITQSQNRKAFVSLCAMTVAIEETCADMIREEYEASLLKKKIGELAVGFATKELVFLSNSD